MKHFRFFLTLFKCIIIRPFKTHPWRIFAVVLGIALGAGIFTSVRLAVYASVDSFSRGMDFIVGKADWVVFRPGGRVPETLVAELQAHTAVDAASPLITTYVQPLKENSEPFLLIGLDPILDRSVRNWQIQATPETQAEDWLSLLTKPDAIFVGQQLARHLGLSSGEFIRLQHVSRTQDFQIIGLLKPAGLARVDGGRTALMDMATIQEFTGLQGLVDRIDLRLKPWANQTHPDRIRALLPPGVVLQPSSETKETGLTMISAYRVNLTLLSFVSLFVGMFLVYSLVSLNAASRRRELAILRSLGASSRMILSLILCEGLVLGMVGWLLSIPIGGLLVKHLIQGVSSTISNLFVRVHVEGLQLNAWEIILSFGITLFISLPAAYRPAHEATRIAPREAMFMRHEVIQKDRSGRGIVFFGLAMILLAWPISELPSPAGMPVAGYSAVFILFAGFSCLAPAILLWMGTYLPPLLRRLGSEAAYLGGRYVLYSGNRTAVAVGALITATALFVSLATMIHSFRYTVEHWVNQTISGDLFLRPKMAGLNQYRDTLPKVVSQGLENLKEDVAIMPFRRLNLQKGHFPYQLEAMELDVFLNYGNFMMLKGNLESISSDLIAGKGVLVSEVFFNKIGMGIGDAFQVNLGGAMLDLPILGVFRDYRTHGGIVYVALPVYQQLTHDQQWSGVRFFFKNRDQDLKTASERLRARILGCCGTDHPVEMVSGAELRYEILKIFDETFAVTTIVLFISLLVAGLGITTSLAVMVWERMHQLNTLLAVGADSGQIRTMILWEAIFMVTAGETMGLICGFILSHLLIDVINLHSFGWTFIYRTDWRSLLISLPLILATALVAALPATRLALQSSPARVLKEY